MRTTLGMAVLLFALSSTAQINPGNYHFSNVNLLSMATGESIEEHVDVIVSGGVIESIETPGTFKDRSYFQIDGKGMYLMPGISEMHAHIPTPQEGDDTYVRETLFLYLSNGITTIRGMLGAPYHLELRAAAENGDVLSPRIYTSSPSLNGNSVQTSQEAIDKVTQYKNDGYDFLKIHPGIKHDVMASLVATADEVGIKFAGHVPFEVGLEKAIEYGYASVDHCDGFMRSAGDGEYSEGQVGFFGSGLVSRVEPLIFDELCQMMKANNVAIVPTQSLFTRWYSPESVEKQMSTIEMTYIPAKTRYAWTTGKAQITNSDDYDAEGYDDFLRLRKKILKSAYDNGVTLLLGSDAPQVMNVPGFSIQHEMQSMVDADIPEYEVLRSGTVSPAAFFGEEGSYGQVVHGASADLILLAANPLDDIRNMAKIEGVMVRGHWLSKDVIDSELARIAKRHSD